MSPDSVFRKTPKGTEEIELRKHKLSPRLRSVLLFVTGTKTAAELAEMAKAIGSPDDTLEQLATGGFIEAVTEGGGTPAAPGKAPGKAPGGQTLAERFIAANRFMDTSVTNAGGLKSYLFQLKLSKCGNMDELREILPAYEKFMAKQVGEAGARVFVAELKSMLA